MIIIKNKKWQSHCYITKIFFLFKPNSSIVSMNWIDVHKLLKMFYKKWHKKAIMIWMLQNRVAHFSPYFHIRLRIYLLWLNFTLGTILYIPLLWCTKRENWSTTHPIKVIKGCYQKYEVTVSLLYIPDIMYRIR